MTLGETQICKCLDFARATVLARHLSSPNSELTLVDTKTGTNGKKRAVTIGQDKQDRMAKIRVLQQDRPARPGLVLLLVP